jgi:hypothetical protein
MTKQTTIILALLAIAVGAYLVLDYRAKHPATKTTDDANSTNLGASVELGGNLTIARYGANTPWLYPPPLAFMMPLATAGDHASTI